MGLVTTAAAAVAAAAVRVCCSIGCAVAARATAAVDLQQHRVRSVQLFFLAFAFAFLAVEGSPAHTISQQLDDMLIDKLTGGLDRGRGCGMGRGGFPTSLHHLPKRG